MWRVKSLDAVLATAEKKSLRRSLGPIQLTLLGIGGIIGTGIFVLTAEAAQKAGPGMMLSFIIAGAVSACAALCYAELASMVPVSGSAYTYSYAVLGELMAWLVGWALILEYAVAASAVSVGWSGYIVGLLANLPHPIVIPPELAAGPYAGGVVNLLAVFIALVITTLLVIGTRESANVNACLVAVKLVALGAFIWLALPVMKNGNFHPFLPNGWGSLGVIGAASSIFFAYVGFDAVSTAAEETKNPQRNLPIGLIASLEHLHRDLSAGGGGGDRFLWRPAGSRSPWRGAGARLDGLAGAMRVADQPTAGLFARGAGACAALHPPSAGRQSAGTGGGHRAAHRHPDDDLWPDPHLLCDVARRAAAGNS